MSTIVGPNNRPITTEPAEAPKETSPSNGEGELDPMTKIHLMPRGLLQLNLATFICKSNDLGNMIGSMKMQMQMQKMVGKPPQMAEMEEELARVNFHRFLICKEINDRERHNDEAYWLSLGLPEELWPTPEELPPRPEEEASEPEPPADAS